MKLPFFGSRKRDFMIEPLRPGDAGHLAELHEEDFARPWSADEFAALLVQDTVFGYAVREVGHPKDMPAGFVLARLVADEGEILTLAVSGAARRQGLGWALMDAVLRELHAQRAAALFLEVDETNVAAVALYRRLGFAQVGRRPAYYGHPDAPATAALVMRRDLR